MIPHTSKRSRVPSVPNQERLTFTVPPIPRLKFARLRLFVPPLLFRLQRPV